MGLRTAVLWKQRRISNTSAPTMETSGVLVGDKVSAAEISLPAFKMGGSAFQNQVSKSAQVPFFHPIVSSHFAAHLTYRHRLSW